MLETTGSPIQLEVEERPNAKLVRLRGQVTEDSAMHEILADAQQQTLIIDASDILRINSCGVRDWVRWIQDLESRNNRLHLIRCSPTVVAQLNMISNFSGQAHVLSVMAPYICPDCGEEHLEPMQTSALGKDPVLPEVKCAGCGTAMEFDEIAESYFEFAAQHAARPVDPVVADWVGGR